MVEVVFESCNDQVKVGISNYIYSRFPQRTSQTHKFPRLECAKITNRMLRSALILMIALPSIFAGVADFDEKWLADVISKYFEKEGRPIAKLDSVRLSPADPPGTVYGSNRTRAVVQMKFKSGEVREDSFLVVALPSHPLREKQLLDAGLFQTDIKVYQHVVPKLDAFLKAHDDNDRMWLKPIKLEEYIRLVLEDPEGRQYHLKNRRDGLNEEHVRVAVEKLAKFHALSAVLKSKNQISVEPFDLALIQKTRGKSFWYATLFREFAKSIRAAWGPEWEKFAAAFDSKAETIQNDILDIIDRDNSKFNTLINGAFDINNLYFKYSQDRKTPVGIKVVNFQNTYWNSPAIELQMLLNTSPEPQHLADDSKRAAIVNHYAESLLRYLKKYGYERPVTAEEIKSEVRRTELVGLAYAVNFLSGIYTSPEDHAYSEDFIIEALKNPSAGPKIDNHGMFGPRFIEVMKKLVQRAQNLGVIRV